MRTTIYGTVLALTRSATAAFAGEPPLPIEPEPCIEAWPAPDPGADRSPAAGAGTAEITDDELARLSKQEALTEVITVGGVSISRRGVVQGYLVMPRGGEFTGSARVITTEDPALGDRPLRFSDLALFELGGRWSVVPRLEVSGQVAVLAKRPAQSHDKPWQSVGLGLRSPLGDNGAISASGAGGHLIGHPGMWTWGSVAVQWRQPIGDFVYFDLGAGGDAIHLTAPHATSASTAEVTASLSVLFHPVDFWGAWISIPYAVPIASTGIDPTTAIAVDPQPRLDLRIGTVLMIEHDWDVFAEYVVIDRGDLARPETRLPILDGGFDQRQILLGITLHVAGAPPHRHR